MTSVTFTIPGQPRPWERVGRGRRGNAYVPQRTKSYEGLVFRAALSALDRRAPWPKDAWYRCEIALYTKDRRIPDTDNVCKAILDGCQGALWANDKRVSAPHPTLVEVCSPEPRAEVTVTIVDPPRGWEKPRKRQKGSQ